MELRQLRYFVAVAQEQNFTRAARRLNIAQPPLSRQIRQLEHETGVLLIERGLRPVRLTEAGKLFYDQAVQALDHVERMVEMTRRLAAAARPRRAADLRSAARHDSGRDAVGSGRGLVRIAP